MERAGAGMAIKRKTITAAMMRQLIINQCVDFHSPVLCGACGFAIDKDDKTIVEHLHPLALGGSDGIDNMRLYHWGCARKKTMGTNATTYGSDIWEIAKGKRLRGETGQNKRKVKIQSRPFQKTSQKRMPGGRVVDR